MLRTALVNRNVANIAAIRLFGPAYFQREKTTIPATTEGAAMSLEDQKKELQKLLATELPKPYDGPERDLVNFPRRKRAPLAGKVRMTFIPDEWFQFFYKKTGVTGPYLFGTGLLTFLLSKELYVIEHEFSTGCAIFLLAYIAVKKFGPATRQFVQKSLNDQIEEKNKEKEACIKEAQDQIDELKKSVWQAQGQKILMEAKRENVYMQLETEYRRRIMHVYEQVKRRLDYQLEFYNTKRKLEQTHMVDWIVNSVVKSISPQQEKEALQKCIEDLKVLSARAN